MAHSYNLREAGGFQVEVQPGLQNETLSQKNNSQWPFGFFFFFFFFLLWSIESSS
jgi:hypothetical protein